MMQQCLRLGGRIGYVRSSYSQMMPIPLQRSFCDTAIAAGPDRSYPTEPRVGVGVVVFRQPQEQGSQNPEVLLIRRAKEPSKGLWCFPGGSQELGETLAQCAAREVREETGLSVQMVEDPDAEGCFSDQLLHPTAFAAVDSLVHDTTGKLRFHYAIVEVAALVSPSCSTQAPQALDDADGAMWYPCSKLRTLPDLTPMCARVTEEAIKRFPVVTRPSVPGGAQGNGSPSSATQTPTAAALPGGS